MKSVRLLSRVSEILKSFTPSCPEITASELSRRVGIPKTTTQRILENLYDNGFLEKNEENGKYKIGAEIYILGSLYLSTTNLLKIAEPIVKTLNDLTSEVVTVSISDKQYITLVMREESKYGFRWGMHVGSIQPAYAAATGKALLSALSDEEIDALYPDEELQPLTTKTVATKTKLKSQIEKIRKSGVAVSSEEVFEGIEGIASLLRDANGKAVAGISISIPVFRLNGDKRRNIATLVRMGSNFASFRLGYRGEIKAVRSIEEIKNWWEQNQ